MKLTTLFLTLATLTYGQQLTYVGIGDCMSPALVRGNVLIVDPVKLTDLRVGDVIAYWSSTKGETLASRLTGPLTVRVDKGAVAEIIEAKSIIGRVRVDVYHFAPVGQRYKVMHDQEDLYVLHPLVGERGSQLGARTGGANGEVNSPSGPNGGQSNGPTDTVNPTDDQPAPPSQPNPPANPPTDNPPANPPVAPVPTVPDSTGFLSLITIVCLAYVLSRPRRPV